MNWKLDKWGSIVDENGDTVKVVGVALPGGTNQEAIKNRSLLLAAPDMLDVLKSMVSALECGLVIQPDCQLQIRAEQAIAKAQGEAA